MTGPGFNDRMTFQTARTPRYVPLTMLVRLLFGGALNQVGWLLLGFGMIFFWGFVMQADFLSLTCFRGEFGSARGTVTACAKSNASEDDTPIFRVDYAFQAPDGRFRRGTSYSPGEKLDPGASVYVEFAKTAPSVSRIRGLRSKPFSPWLAVVGVAPLAGLVLILFGIRGGLRRLRLLRFGRAVTGTLKSKEATHTQINDQMVYKLTFEFETEGGEPREAMLKTHRTKVRSAGGERVLTVATSPEEEASRKQAAAEAAAKFPAWLRGVVEKFARRPLPELFDSRVVDEANGTEEARLLYDPADPSRIMLVDNAPEPPLLDEAGDLLPAGPLGTLAVLFLPALTLIGHGTYVYLAYLK